MRLRPGLLLYKTLGQGISRKQARHTFFSFHRAKRPTPETFTTLKRTPGISPLALPRRPKPEMSTSSFSSTKFRQPSFWVDCHLHILNPQDIYTYRYESSDLFAVFDKLNSDTLPNGRVGLFGFNTDFLEDDTLSMWWATRRRSLPHVSESTLFVRFVGLIMKESH